MRLIKLKMTVGQWLGLPEIDERISVRARNGLLNGRHNDKQVRNLTMMEFCYLLPREVLKIRNVGVGTLKEYNKLLAVHGLHFGPWLDDEPYDGDFEDEAPPAKPETPDGIDWEQRRWQLAHGIFLHYSDLTNKTCIEMADIFIEEYKKSLNAEEEQWKHWC